MHLCTHIISCGGASIHVLCVHGWVLRVRERVWCVSCFSTVSGLMSRNRAQHHALHTCQCRRNMCPELKKRRCFLFVLFFLFVGKITKDKTGGGDFDATVSVLRQAAQLSRQINGSGSISLLASHVGGGVWKDQSAGAVGTAQGDEREVSWEEEGPEPGSQEAEARGEEDGGVMRGRDKVEFSNEKQEGDTVEEVEEAGTGISHKLFKDLEKSAKLSGQAEGEEVSPYHVPVSSAIIPWWDARAWEARAKQFRAARGSHVQGEDAAWTSRVNSADAASAASADSGSKIGKGKGDTMKDQPGNARDEWGNVILSQGRASFPTGEGRQSVFLSTPAVDGPGNRRGEDVGEANLAQQMQTGGAEGKQDRAGLSGDSARGAGLSDDLLKELEAVEKMERIARKRLLKFQDRMTPKGFKGGTIIKDHVDFGGGKGADLDGER